MAGKRGNGGSNGNDPILTALHEVVAELRGTNVRLERVEGVLLETRQEQRETNFRLGKVEERLETTNARLGQVEERIETTNARLGRVEERLENIRDLAGGQYRLLEERVAKLEARLPLP